VDFKPEEPDAWFIAKQLGSLSRAGRYQVRLLIECIRELEALEEFERDMEKSGKDPGLNVAKPVITIDHDDRPGA
jgi:hypothetical protein